MLTTRTETQKVLVVWLFQNSDVVHSSSPKMVAHSWAALLWAMFCASPVLSISPFFSRSPSSQPTFTPICEGAIECALEQVLIGPLEFCVDVPVNRSAEVIGLCMWDFTCDNIALTSIESEYVTPHTLQIAVDNLGIDCRGEWNVTETNTSSNESLFIYEGAFSLGMSDLTAETTAEFTNYSTAYALPNALIFSNCSVPSASFQVHFLGGAIGKTLDLTLAPRLEEGLEEHVEELLCGLGDALGSGLSSAIVESNIAREDTIDAGRASYPPPVINGTYDWRTSKLATVHAILDTLSLHSAAGSGGDMASCLLNGSALDILRPPPSEDSEDLLVNRLLDLLTNGTGEVQVPLHTVIPLGNTSSLEFTSLVVKGLDSFTNLSLLVPSPESGAVLSSAVGMEQLELQLFLTLNASSSEGAWYTEEMVVTLALSEVLLELDMVVALSEDTLAGIAVGQYLNESSCVLLALQELSLSSLVLHVGVQEVSLKQISGDATSLEEDVVLLVDNLLEWLLRSWPITELLSGLGQTVIKDQINANLEDRRTRLQVGAEESCPASTLAEGVQYVNWNESVKITRLNAILNTAFGADGLNSLMDCVTGGTGELTLSRNGSNSSSLTLSGLDSFYDFALLYPMSDDPHALGNSIALGQCDSSQCKPFGLIFRGQILHKEVYLELEMQNVAVFLDLLFLLDQTEVLNLNLMQLQTRGCVMTAAESLLVQASSLTLTDAELYLDDGESEPTNITHAVEVIVAHFEEVGGLVGKLNEVLLQLTDSAEERCAGTYDPSSGNDEASVEKSDGSPKDWTWQLALLLIGCVLSLVFLAYLYQHFGVMTREEEAHRDSMDELKHGSLLGEKLVDSSLSELDSGQEEKSNPTLEFATRVLGMCGYGHIKYDALFSSASLPLVVRVLYPFAVMGCIATTIKANVAIGTSVMLELNIGDIKLEPPSVFDFALGNTVSDMWSAGVYPLALLVAFFSGAWPYIKLLTMLALWFLPSAAVTVTRRGSVLKWLDILGKWSLIDAYVMVMMMVAFHVELYIGSGISMIITVEPRIGFNLFLLSVLTSLGLGHISMGCHRMDTEEKIRLSSTRKAALQEHVFPRMCFLDSNQDTGSVGLRDFRFTTLGKGLVTCSILGCIFLVVAGVFLLTFVFHFKGLIGFMLGSEDDVDYSLVTTGTSVSTATGDPDSLIVRWIQACFFGFGVVMPLLFLLLMLVVWVIPLRLTTYRKLVVLAEVANAWCAIDVFVVSVVAALFEIQQFAAFIIGDSCDAINELLEEKNPNPDGDNKCFDVTAGLLPNFWVLGLAAGIMMTFGLWLLRIAQSDLVNRRMDDRNRVDDSLMLQTNLCAGEREEKVLLYERNGESILSPESSMSSVPVGGQEDEGPGWVDRWSARTTERLQSLRIICSV